MKKIKVLCGILIGAMMMGTILFACSPSPEVVSEETATDATITSDWELVKFIVNGTETLASEYDKKENEIIPGFEASSETECVFYNNGEGHKGTMELVDGVYNITFEGSQNGVGMLATLSGNKLTIVNTTGTLEFEFIAK